MIVLLQAGKIAIIVEGKKNFLGDFGIFAMM
jgi:hypothetical protein